MALDPTLNTYALGVCGASALAAAGMHVTHVASNAAPWPPTRKLCADLVRAAWVGACIEELIRYGPGNWQLVPVLLASGVVGGTLGPRGLGWLLAAGWAVTSRLIAPLAAAPAPPGDDPAPLPKETSPVPEVDNVPKEPE